jgi:DNA-binding CsgD family transcriptional regulator
LPVDFAAVIFSSTAMKDPSVFRKRLTDEQRDEILRRVLAGESSAKLGEEFGVTRAYVSLLKNQALDPDRFTRKKEEKLALKLTPRQREELERVISTSTPEDNDLIPARDRWSIDHGYQLAEKLFNKRPSVRAMKEIMAPYIKRYEDVMDEKPKPPKKHHINQLEPELAKDPDFVAYYLSPVCEQIAWREYELALKDWERRQEARQKMEQEAEYDDDISMPPMHGMPGHAPGVRTGKHAKGRGPRHTPPKRRKKRRK